MRLLGRHLGRLLGAASCLPAQPASLREIQTQIGCSHLKRPSARAEIARESPSAIVQARRLAARGALASHAWLLFSFLMRLLFLFSAALATSASLAMLDAL